MTIELHSEIVLKGVPAAPGIAIGPSYLFRKQTPEVQERHLTADVLESESIRLDNAIARSKKELVKILDFAEQKLGPQQSKIFEAQMMILDDLILFETIKKNIRSRLRNAEFIVQEEINKYQRMMSAAKDEYTRERANDLEDVKNRIIRNMQEERLVSKVDGSSIIISHTLAAADALVLSRNEVLAYATEGGGATSHMALLSRALKIPAVVGLHQFCSMVHPGDPVIVDGYSGAVVINPSRETIRFYERKKTEHLEFESRLATLRDLPAETLDGHRITLSANVELEQELNFLKLQGSDGIGLYRSETLLLGREDFPTEEEQYRQYKLLADSLAPKNVIIRTFDIGGDKLMSHAVKESNPFLGWRGIRVMLDKPEIFLDQLRAILRASGRKNVSVMFPMVSNIKEV
ncbi:MAG: phosphoenolpyruvate--protein phosphotransferase, partial [Ignavibacteriales bacterium]|nr:phosphoenolpyruvate--protein phosphotransferase [Ignavibacteriales bacterium]